MTEVVVGTCLECPFVKKERWGEHRCGSTGARLVAADSVLTTNGGRAAGFPVPPLWCPLEEKTVTLTVKLRRSK